jgi:hypothetical protein
MHVARHPRRGAELPPALEVQSQTLERFTERSGIGAVTTIKIDFLHLNQFYFNLIS